MEYYFRKTRIIVTEREIMLNVQGIIVPLLTPLATPETIDEAAARRLVDHVIAGGVRGIFILGSTGEGPALSGEAQRAFIRICVDAVGGRVPLLAGISGASAVDSTRLGKFAAEAGADAAVAAPPCYLPPDEDEQVAFYRYLAKEVPLPLFVYNMPSLTRVSLQLSALERILAIPGVAGYKDSSGDLAAFRAVLEHFGSRPDLSLLVGPDELTGEAVMLGADGGVNGGANLNPRLFADLYEAAERKDAAKVAELQARVLEQGKLYGTPVTTPGVIRAMKREAARMGLCRNVLAVPALPLQ